jgi:hypothetical protein
MVWHDVHMPDEHAFTLGQVDQRPDSVVGPFLSGSAERRIEELAENDFNLSIERYVLAPEMRRMRELAASATTVVLEDIAELHRPQAIPGTKGMNGGPQIELTEVGVTDIDEAGVVGSRVSRCR